MRRGGAKAGARGRVSSSGLTACVSSSTLAEAATVPTSPRAVSRGDGEDGDVASEVAVFVPTSAAVDAAGAAPRSCTMPVVVTLPGTASVRMLAAECTIAELSTESCSCCAEADGDRLVADSGDVTTAVAEVGRFQVDVLVGAW